MFVECLIDNGFQNGTTLLSSTWSLKITCKVVEVNSNSAFFNQAFYQGLWWIKVLGF